MKKIGLMLFVLVLTACGINDKQVEENVEKPEEQNASTVEEQASVQDLHSFIATEHFYKERASGKMDHIHGLGYVAGEDGLFVATHYGLQIFHNGKWYAADTEQHDFMGFQAVNDGFYASGHPEHGSSLKDPLGLIKSHDYGQSFDMLSLYGEADFHFLAVGFENHTVYAINEHRNSQLDIGLYFTTDDGDNWEQSNINGIPNAGISAIAAHPIEEGTVALGTEAGVYLSTNFGDDFDLFSDEVKVSSLILIPEAVLYSFVLDEKVALVKQDIKTKEKELITLPELKDKDLIIYIAVNPGNEREIVIATASSSIYRTQDQGETWEQIVKEGEY